MDISLYKVTEFSYADIAELITTSTAENFRHMQRLWDDFQIGKNRFDKRGEILLLAKIGEKVVGVCGLNRYDYWGENVARLRRMYVLKEYRRMGIARKLTEEIIKNARENFDTIVLKTDNPGAFAFYKSLGFDKVAGDEFVTHVLKIR
ncbi:MAG: GNAT family N-acetyltransferase [Bacteroidota bacterium]